jgi:hypothetical protein
VRISIPRTAKIRREACYATLIRRVISNPTGFAFQGLNLRCGAIVDESELWPSDEYPLTPLLLEYAGRDFDAQLEYRSPGTGHKRRPDLRLLWRYDRRKHLWRELARCSSVSRDGIEYLLLIARQELSKQPCPVAPEEMATRASSRAIEVLDTELAQLDGQERVLAISQIYDQVVSRVVALRDDMIF